MRLSTFCGLYRDQEHLAPSVFFWAIVPLRALAGLEGWTNDTCEGYTGESGLGLAGVGYTGESKLAGVAYTGEFLWEQNFCRLTD